MSSCIGQLAIVLQASLPNCIFIKENLWPLIFSVVPSWKFCIWVSSWGTPCGFLPPRLPRGQESGKHVEFCLCGNFCCSWSPSLTSISSWTPLHKPRPHELLRTRLSPSLLANQPHLPPLSSYFFLIYDFVFTFLILFPFFCFL